MRKPMLEARQEVSKHEIIQVATRLFAEQGVRATSLAQLAEALGVTKAALYYYFSSKQEIVIETVHANMRDFLAQVMAPIEDTGGMQTLLARVDRKLEQIDEEGALPLRFFYTVMLEELDEPEVEKVYQDFWAQAGAEARRAIEGGKSRGEIRDDEDVDTIINVLTAMSVGIDILWLNDPEHVDPHKAYMAGMKLLLASLAPPRRRQAKA